MATRRIGELLVAEGLLTEGAVERALGFQRLTGEHIKLGSILLNWDLLGEDALLEALARMHRCPPVPWSVLSRAAIEAVRLLPAAHAIRFGAIPYDLEKTLVRVAFSNPGDLAALDEVARIAGRRVAAGVATEIRIMQAHQRFYGRHVPLEFRAIMQKIERRGAAARPMQPAARSQAAESEARLPASGVRAAVGLAIEISAPAPAGAAPAASALQIQIPEAADPDLPVSQTGAPEVFTGEDSLSKWLEDALSAFRDPAWNPGRPSTRVPPPDRIEPATTPRQRATQQPRIEARVEDTSAHRPDPVADMWRVPSREADTTPSDMWTPESCPPEAAEPARMREKLAEDVIHTVLGELPRVLVLGRGSDSITGWAGKGPDITRDRVLSVRISLREATIFSRMLATGQRHRGAPEKSLWPRALGDLLGSNPPDCAVFPILIRGRSAAFIYADRIDRPLQREDLARLERAAAAMASGFSLPPRSDSAAPRP